MRIAIIGAGALGCLYGGTLAASGHDVWLLHHRQSAVDRIQKQGVNIEGSGDRSISVFVPATTNAADVGTADLVFVFVKAHQTVEALEQHADCIGPDTLLLSLQNGLRHYDQLVDVVGVDRAFAGVTYQSAKVETPGEIIHTGDRESIFGGADSQTAAELARLLTDAGLPAEAVDDPVAAIWSKQLVSLPVKPVAALTRLPNGQLVESDETRAIMAEIVREAEAVATAIDIELPDGDPMDEIVEICRSGPDHRSSMLQDVLEERKTEIDEINGAVVDIAETENIEVPTNRLVTRLVRGLERGYLG